MYIQKVDVPLRAYTTVKTYYNSTYFTGQLLEIEYDPSTNTPLCDTTKNVLEIYRHSTEMASNLIFKHALPSTGKVWRPRYPINESTGQVLSSSDISQGWRPWNFADDRIRVVCGQSTDAAALRATLNFYIG